MRSIRSASKLGVANPVLDTTTSPPIALAGSFARARHFKAASSIRSKAISTKVRLRSEKECASKYQSGGWQKYRRSICAFRYEGSKRLNHVDFDENNSVQNDAISNCVSSYCGTHVAIAFIRGKCVINGISSFGGDIGTFNGEENFCFALPLTRIFKGPPRVNQLEP